MNSWVLVLTLWQVGAPQTTVAIDPIGYYPRATACEMARQRATSVVLPTGVGRKIECVFNGA